jgi:N-acetylglutamate synthase-like GNAT family acetyltransferase
MSSSIIPIPPPLADVSVRDATLADVAFIDSLQKIHSKQVGFMSRGQLEGKFKAGEVLVAEDATGKGVGYCIGTDRYFKHDDVGIIYQLNVAPGRQRGFVGATLLKAMFDRAAYGCRLFCCWCAQDIEANRFWEACGFVPLAFRAGSEKKRRVHIFWCKRIREGDTTTPWWFPSETKGGSMMEDRLVFPIPPGTHWSDAKPIVLPGMSSADEPKQLPGPRTAKERARAAVTTRVPLTGGLSFAPPAPVPAEKKPREKKPKRKNDPRLVAAARELKDRWLEHVNAGQALIESAGKYDVVRQPLAETLPEPMPLLPAA